MGGYTWYKNSRLNRLTAWANNPTNDIPSEIIYLEDMENKKVWSLGQNPIPDSNDYYITYGLDMQIICIRVMDLYKMQAYLYHVKIVQKCT